MRLMMLGWMLALSGLAGCAESGTGAAPKDSGEAMKDRFQRAAESRAARSEPRGGAAAGPRLEVPLPGGVLPGFDHDVASDLSSRQVHATRIVSLRARGSSAREALESLAAAFGAAGFEKGTPGSHKDQLLQEFWTPGPARGIAAVSAGGTRIGVSARDFPPDSESAREGFTALVMVTVNSP